MDRLEITWPLDAEQAIRRLQRNLADRHRQRIRQCREDELDRLYEELAPYVAQHSGCLTAEVSGDIGVSTTQDQQRAGAEFLIFLLWKRLRAQETGS